MKWFVRDVTNTAIRERGLHFLFFCVMQRGFCFFRGNKNNFLRGGRNQEQLTRDVLCITFPAKPTLSLLFYLISPQQRLAATPCHIKNLPAGGIHNWFEQMAWHRSVITSDERIQQHNRTISSLVSSCLLCDFVDPKLIQVSAELVTLFYTACWTKGNDLRTYEGTRLRNYFSCQWSRTRWFLGLPRG